MWVSAVTMGSGECLPAATAETIKLTRFPRRPRAKTDKASAPSLLIRGSSRIRDVMVAPNRRTRHAAPRRPARGGWRPIVAPSLLGRELHDAGPAARARRLSYPINSDRARVIASIGTPASSTNRPEPATVGANPLAEDFHDDKPARCARPLAPQASRAAISVSTAKARSMSASVVSVWPTWKRTTKRPWWRVWVR